MREIRSVDIAVARRSLSTVEHRRDEVLAVPQAREQDADHVQRDEREQRPCERDVECGEELVTDHEGRRRPAPFAARRVSAW